jgi:hypothetical protein
MLQTNAQELKVESALPATHRSAHEFSQIPLPPKSPANVQAKLVVGLPGDIHEQEADHIADQIVRQKIPVEGAYQKAEIQTKPSQQHAKAEPDIDIDEKLERRLATPSADGRPLSDDVRAFVEPSMQFDFGNVRIHTDNQAAQLNQELGARALTYGDDIYFGAGQYSPSNNSGRRLIAHELVHVMQQSQVIQRMPDEPQRQTVERVTRRIELKSDLVAEGETPFVPFTMYKENPPAEYLDSPDLGVHYTFLSDDIFSGQSMDAHWMTPLLAAPGRWMRIEVIDFGWTFWMRVPSGGGLPEVIAAPQTREMVAGIRGSANRVRALEEARRQAEKQRLVPDWVHTLLDVAGLYPGLGIIPDAANAGLYIIEGDWTNATISAVAMLPLIGAGAFLTRRGIVLGREVIERVSRKQLIEALAYLDDAARQAMKAVPPPSSLKTGPTEGLEQAGRLAEEAAPAADVAIPPRITVQGVGAASPQVDAGIARLGAMSEESVERLQSQPRLVEWLNDSPDAARVLKKCESDCWPENITESQLVYLQRKMENARKLGVEIDEEALRKYLYARRAGLDSAIRNLSDDISFNDIVGYFNQGGKVEVGKLMPPEKTEPRISVGQAPGEGAEVLQEIGTGTRKRAGASQAAHFDIGNFGHRYWEALDELLASQHGLSNLAPPAGTVNLPADVVAEFTVKVRGGTIRMDRISMSNRIIYEIKPNNAPNITAGHKQAHIYTQYMNQQYPGNPPWTYQVITYDFDALMELLRRR